MNPVAWDKGMVMGQCGTCQVWHVLAANNTEIYEEIRYKEKEPAAASSTSASDNNSNGNGSDNGTLPSSPSQTSSS